MEAIVPGSSQFKEAARRCLVKIEFRKLTEIQKSTIGVVLVSEQRCFVIAPSAKFVDTDVSQFIIMARSSDDALTRIHRQDVVIRENIAMFYMENSAMPFNEMEICEEALEMNATIYLFSFTKDVGAIIPPGNVTLAGADFFRHDCTSPSQQVEITIGGTRVPFVYSGVVLLNAAGRLIGIVSENNLTNRAVAMNSARIIQQVTDNNENLADFIERIRGNAILP